MADFTLSNSCLVAIEIENDIELVYFVTTIAATIVIAIAITDTVVA